MCKNEGGGEREKSQGFTFLVEPLLLISHFTKQDFCATDLVTSSQSITLQLRIKKKNWFS